MYKIKIFMNQTFMGKLVATWFTLITLVLVAIHLKFFITTRGIGEFILGFLCCQVIKFDEKIRIERDFDIIMVSKNELEVIIGKEKENK